MHASCVLVVEDDPAMRAAIRRAVSAYYDVIESDNRTSAIALARHHHPALILLDLGLPGLDEWGVEKLLSALPSLEPIPILGLADDAAPQARAAALRAGCSQVIQKPFALITLREALVGLLALPAGTCY